MPDTFAPDRAGQPPGEAAQPAGLDAADAAARLTRDGPNLLPGSAPRTLWDMVRGVFTEPMFLMLLVAGGIYLLLGDRAEAALLLAFVFVVIGITLAQERKTQRALESLRDLSAPRALVIRDGVEARIAGRDVVRGDLLVLHEGDRVAADALLVQGQLTVDESLLTGEAVPVDKLPAPEPDQPVPPATSGPLTLASPPDATAAGAPATPGGDGTPHLFASTVITKGVGLARVNATGTATAVGRIGQALAAATEPPSGLQQASRRLIVQLTVVGMLLATAQILLGWLWDGHSLLASVLSGIALAMAILPEEIPVILTVFLALGAWRISQHKVLTRRMSAVEALGAITVLATDKTGTLTQNVMRVAELRAGGASFSPEGATGLPEPFHALAEFALLATPADPFDPMEKSHPAVRPALAGRHRTCPLRLDTRDGLSALAGHPGHDAGVCPPGAERAPAGHQGRARSGPAAPRGLRRAHRVPRRRRARHDGDRRSPRHRHRDRPRRRPHQRRRPDRPRDRRARRRRAARAPARHPDLRPRHARSEAADRADPDRRRRGRGHDRRRGQRRPGPARRRDRRGHGRARHRRRPRGRRDRPDPRRLQRPGRRRRRGPPDLRQPAQGARLHRRRPRADRRRRPRAAVLRPADAPPPDPHRLPRAHHRSRLLDRLRGRAGAWTSAKVWAWARTARAPWCSWRWYAASSCWCWPTAARAAPRAGEPRQTNPWLLRMAAAVVLLLVAVNLVPWLRNVMHFAQPDRTGFAAAFAMLVGVGAWLGLTRRGAIWKKQRLKSPDDLTPAGEKASVSTVFRPELAKDPA
jgi:hypothetical protein